jgi:transposase
MTCWLLVLADRLAGLGVTRVVMEATSDYWKPGCATRFHVSGRR